MAELIQIARGVSAIRFMLDKPHVRIGRGRENDICLSDAFVSKEHAIIETRPSDQLPGIYDFYLRDLGSTNHTFVNKTQISYQQLRNNDTVHIGHNEFRFVCAEKGLKQRPDQMRPEQTADLPSHPPSERNASAIPAAHNENISEESSDPSFSRRLNFLQ